MKEGMIHLRVRKYLESEYITYMIFNVISSDKDRFYTKYKKSKMINI